MDFEKWLAGLFGHDKADIALLLRSPTATQFLIAWSIFESKCFSGYVKFNEISDYSSRVVKEQKFDVKTVSESAAYFHKRYQDADLYRNLMHRQKSTAFDDLLSQDFRSLVPEDVVFLTIATIYRYRNNIFHGNKKVHAWLKFEPQIQRCTSMMQQFVNHAEVQTGSLKTPAAA